MSDFKRGDKVVLNGRTYDFGYMGQTGLAIIYEEGECNMQDSVGIDPSKLRRLEDEDDSEPQTFEKSAVTREQP